MIDFSAHRDELLRGNGVFKEFSSVLNLEMQAAGSMSLPSFPVSPWQL